MLSPQHIRRFQKILIFIGLGLAGYYLFVFFPLAQKAVVSDKPLREAWAKLSQSRVRSIGTQIDLDDLDRQLKETKAAIAAVDRATGRIRSSVASDAEGRLKSREQFQLVDFQIEKLLRIEEIGRFAQQSNIVVGTNVFINFPEYRADKGIPELLWGQLIFVDQVLATAIRCNVSAIQTLELPPCTSFIRSTNEAPFLYEVPVRVELTGSMESISKLLASLPLRSDETTAAKLPQAPADKPAIFVNKFILTKSSPQDPDQAKLDLMACGFVYRD